MKTLLVIAGPTAVGKTAVAIDVAGRLGTAIISADSRQCYRELSIGTAKPTPAELTRVKHYFIDTFSVTEGVTAARFEQLALGWLEEIFRTADVAVVCGGTGLYIRALCEGLDQMPAMDPAVVSEVEAGFKENGLSWLQACVREEDALFFAQGERENPARLLRALGFVRSTGESIIKYRSGVRKVRPFRIVKACLTLSRPLLYERINKRVVRMMENGLAEEVSGLRAYRDLKALQTVGYAELFDHLEGKLSLEAAVDKIGQHTRNYAKRQLTWFAKDPGFVEMDAMADGLAESLAGLIAEE